MINRIWFVKYWREINDEKTDFEEEINAPNLEKALEIFKEQRSINIYRIESIIEQIKK